MEESQVFEKLNQLQADSVHASPSRTRSSSCPGPEVKRELLNRINLEYIEEHERAKRPRLS